MPKTLVDLLPEFEIELIQSSNGRWVAVCPFHKGDRDPSFTVYTHNDTYFCFGCQVWGDPVKFLCDYKGWDSKKAQEYVGWSNEFKRADKSKIIKIKDTARMWEYLSEVSQVYHQHLLETNGAYTYLRFRGLSDETISNYRLGYTDGRVLQIGFAHEYQLALEAGLVNPKGFEMMSHRITIPNFNWDTKRNSVDFVMGRTVINDRIKYLGTRLPKPIYGYMRVFRSPILFVAEGQFDWLMLSQWGYPAVVLSGTHLPSYHRALFRNKLLVIIPDNDEAGMAAARSLNNIFPNSNILDYTALGVKDIGELGAKRDGNESFDQIIKEQEWYKNILTSRAHLMKWLPISLQMTPSP